MRESLVSRAEVLAAEERQRLLDLKAKLSTDAERREQQKANIRAKFRGEIEKKLTGDSALVKEVADDGVTLEELALMIVNAVLADEAPKTDPIISPEPVTRVETPIVYESLTQAEIDSLPERARAELQAYLDLHGLLAGFDASDPDELEAVKELIEESFNNVPKVEAIKFVVRLKLVLGGIGSVDKTKLINFINGVTDKAKAILKVPVKPVTGTTNAPTGVGGVATGVPANPNIVNSVGEFEPDELPEHLDRGPLVQYYFKQFEKALTFGGENGDQVAYDYLIREANAAMTRFLDSGSAQGSGDFSKRFLAMWDVLKDFNPKKIAAEKSRPMSIRGWGVETNKTETDQKKILQYEMAQKLRDKGLELLFFSYVAEFAIKHGTPKSLVSDWSHLLEMEKADTDNFGSGVSMFDFFLSDGESEKMGKYKHSGVFTYLMWELPQMIREVEKDLGQSWNDGFPDAHVEALNAKIKLKIQTMRSEVEANGIFTQKVTQHKRPSDKTGRWGVDEAEFNFTKKDFAELTDTSVELIHLLKYVTLYGTATGVRQHLFMNDLARGSTPGGAMSDNKDWIVKCSRFALSNYQCYKGAVPHPLTEGFEINWVANRGAKPDAKQIVIVSSILQTESVLERVMRIRSERVNLGTLNDDINSPIESSYPDLYSFVVRAHQKRMLGEVVHDERGNIVYETKDGQRLPKRTKPNPAKFEAYIAGLNAVDEFVTQALKVPGGVSDKEKIKSMKPSELRAAMLKDLVDLIQKKVSPMKSNQDWVNWRHVVQYILMFVDRMYRVYKLCDDTPDGRMTFTHQIRQTFVSESYNLAGITGPWIKDYQIDPAKEFAGGQAVEAAGLAKKFAGDSRFAGVWEAGHVKSTQENAKLDLRDWILSRLPTLDSGKFMTIGPKERPIYGRIVGQASGPAIDKLNSVQRVKGPVGSAFENKGVFSMDNILHNGSDAFTNLWYDFVNEGAIPNFQKGIWQVIIGTPAEEQKKVADDKK